MNPSRSHWIHVSTLARWRRPPVGIVRMEQEYCRWLLGDGGRAALPAGDHVRFCIYHRRRGEFREVSPAQVMRWLSRTSVARGSPEIGTAQEPAPLAAWVRGLMLRLPPKWVGWARARLAGWRPVLGRGADFARRALRALAGRLTAWVGTVAAGRRAAAMQPGDTWFSMGLDWDDLDDLAAFRLKTAHGVRVVRFCHDVIPYRLPHLTVHTRARFAAYLVEMAWSADLILCNSAWTRQDLVAALQELGAPVPPMRVVHPGVRARATGALSVDQTDRPGMGSLGDRPFVLYVSTIERRKNHDILYRAWLRLREQGDEPHRLVLVGMRGWGVQDLLNDLRLDPRLHDDIEVREHVTDRELDELYRQAAFTVFPSLYEGWGLPVAESLAHGRFCLCADTSSLREVGGVWCDYLDPWNLDAWVTRLAFYMHDPQALAIRQEQIAREYRPTAWDEAAASLFACQLGRSMDAEVTP